MKFTSSHGLSIAFTVVLGVLSSCSERTVRRTYWGDESPASIVTYRGAVLDGPYTLHYPGGQRRVELFYRDGLRHGRYTAWYPDGTRLASGEFVEGLRVGPWPEWTDGGVPHTAGSYKLGDKDGTWIVYDDDGRPAREETWVAGTRVAHRAL